MTSTIGELTPLIGQMTVLWNDTQAIVYIIFDDMLGSDHERTKALFLALRSDGAQRYVTAALARAVIKDDVLLEDLNAEMDAFGKMAGRRNDFIHTIWHTADTSIGVEPWLDMAKRLVGKDPVREVNALIQDLYLLLAKMIGLRRRIKDHLTQPKNALSLLSPYIPGLLSARPPQQDARTANLGQAPLPDDPEVPPPPRPASEE